MQESKWQSSAQVQHMLVLCGLIGSGKSTFAKSLAQSLPNWVRCNQDELGSRDAVSFRARRSLLDGKNVIIDRTNIDPKQRRTWLDLAHSLPRIRVIVTAVTLTTSLAECEARLRLRTEHETIHSVEQALDVLHRFCSTYIPPTREEGFYRAIEVGAGILSKQPTLQELEGIMHEIENETIGEGKLPPEIAGYRPERGRGRGGGRGRGNTLFAPHGDPSKPVPVYGGVWPPPPWRSDNTGLGRPWQQTPPQSEDM